MSKKILVADDDPTLVVLAKQKLEEKGYTVETARNGREAMRVIETTPIDLIILDVVMPLMDGVDVYKELKKTPNLATIPIVIMTDSRIFRESFQTLGVEHFLPKPVDTEKLLHKVEYIFTCVDLQRKNKQILVLSGHPDINNEMGKALEGHGMIVGRSTDPIDFINTSLILSPRVVLIDALLKGDVSPQEVIRALRCFGRLRETRILVFTKFSPEDVDSMAGIEQLSAAKDICMAAGAHKYIGRFTPATFWENLHEYFL